MTKNNENDKLKQLIEAAIFIAEKPLSLDYLRHTLLADLSPSANTLKICLEQLKADYQNRGISLVEVASGFRFQARAELSEQLTVLFQEKSPKYSRALLETLALVAYRQPITRGEIEDIRGVAVSSHIVKTLLERNWLKVLGHKEVPGRPALYGTTKEFLDYFALSSLQQLPKLMETEDSQKFELS